MRRLTPVLCIMLAVSNLNGAEKYDPDRLEKEVLVNGLADGMEMDVLLDGRILVIERYGGLKLYTPKDKRVVKLGEVPAVIFGEVGLVGMTAAPDFERSGWVYVLYCPKAKSSVMRLARLTVKDEKLVSELEKVLLEYPIDGPEAAIHMGGGLAHDSKGNLYIGTGDNSPPIPELPVDQRPGQEVHDAQRSAANSMDLRGKVLRIHPEPDGSYTTPPGNLFPDGKDGKREIYAMGVRNPFRVMIDPRNDWLYWGDVGPNVDLSIKVGPNGYDEINQCRKAGNFGWPMFVGPNEPYSEFDFTTRKAGRQFDPAHPENRSKNNTGLKILPPPQPAFIWYPTFESKEWPQLGSGGRSGMVGPVYYFDAKNDSPIKLPEEFDRTLFIFDWMRNWIAACKLDADGKLQTVELFAKHLSFRRPIDMRSGPDGALYVLEYGDKWSGNTDGQIVRLAYRRGNRPPVARLSASKLAGKQPLFVSFDAGASFDKDGDPLSYSWSLSGKPLTGTNKVVHWEFNQPGVYPVRVTVTDPHGASDSAELTVRVGNAMPEVRFLEPIHGGFFDWDQPIAYRVDVTDEEDGSTADKTIRPERVIVKADYQIRRRSPANEALHPGLALMQKTTCFSCHTTEGQSKGPPYQAVAQKYKDKKEAREMLASKVIAGGAGVWGSYPMPPHPQHTLDQTRQMVDWVLSLTRPPTLAPLAGTEGAFVPALHVENLPTGFPDAGVQVITASYTDNGAGAMPPLTGERTIVLHARRKKAAYHDFGKGAQVVDDVEDERGMIAWFSRGDYVGFSEMNLEGIEKLVCRVWARAGEGGQFEIRLDEPAGQLLAKVDVPPGRALELPVGIPPTAGLHDVYIIAITKSKDSSRKTISLNWIEFQDSPEAAKVRRVERSSALGVLAEKAKSAPKARPFVRAWTVNELKASLDTASADVARGERLFKELSCIQCHRFGSEGGKIGPDLTEVGARMKKQPSPREALLVEIIEPSKVIEEKYRTHVMTLNDGRQLAGIIVEQTNEFIRIAADPAHPDDIRTIPRSRIEQLRKSDLSLMPVGLINTLMRDEIRDLLAFLEGKR